MLLIDGSYGEGGGQILRTSLALSLVTGTPFRIENIRAFRRRPGLMRQHLTSVNAAVAVGSADVAGNEIGSLTLDFAPKTVQAGSYHFAVGTAGSSTLVFQTVLPALLLTVDQPSQLIVEGGTHNPVSPSFDVLTLVFLPILRRMGAQVTTTLEQYGFYPAGGGRFRVAIEPLKTLIRVDLLARGAVKNYYAKSVISRLPRHIAEREIRILRDKLGWEQQRLLIEYVENSPGPGNILSAIVECEQMTEIFTGFGERGVPAEKVGNMVTKEVQEYLQTDVPVGRHLADQLIIPMALAGGGAFRTLSPTTHTTTNIEIVKQFLDVPIAVTQVHDTVWEITIGARR